MQDLAATLIKIDICRKFPENLTVAKIDEIKSIIDKSIDDVYRIIRNLRPPFLTTSALKLQSAGSVTIISNQAAFTVISTLIIRSVILPSSPDGN